LVASLTMASLVLQAPANSTTFFDNFLKYVAPILALLSSIIAAGCLLTLLKYRVDMLERANKEIEKAAKEADEKLEKKLQSMEDEFHEQMHEASKNLARATSDIQLIASNQNAIQKLTTDTLTGMLNRIDENSKIANDHTTMLAVVNTEMRLLSDSVRSLHEDVKNGKDKC